MYSRIALSLCVMYSITGSISTIYALHNKNQSKEYNTHATALLQAKINTLKTEAEYAAIGSPNFLASVNQLLLDGANPNISLAHDNNTTLIMLLFGAPFFKKDLSFPLLEMTIQTALKRGAQIDINGDQGHAILGVAIIIGSPPMLKLAVDYGADITQKDAFGDTPLIMVEKAIVRNKEILPTLAPELVPQVQVAIDRFEQIRDILQSALQKKIIPYDSTHNTYYKAKNPI